MVLFKQIVLGAPPGPDFLNYNSLQKIGFDFNEL